MEKHVCLSNHTVLCPLYWFQLSCDLTFYLTHKQELGRVVSFPVLAHIPPPVLLSRAEGSSRMTAFVLIASALLMQIAASLCELLFSWAAG